MHTTYRPHRVIGLVDDGLKPGFMNKLGAMDALDDVAPTNRRLMVIVSTN
jgi:hypothetical protein